MRLQFPVFNPRIGGPDFDVRLLRWAVVPAISLATIHLMAVRFPKIARDRVELIMCLLGASLLFLLLMLYITLLIHLTKAASEGKLRSRSVLYLSYAASLTLLIVGVRLLPAVGFVSEGDIRVGLMLLCSTCLAILSLGTLASLTRVSKV
jgi:hypothetical protein